MIIIMKTGVDMTLKNVVYYKYKKGNFIKRSV